MRARDGRAAPPARRGFTLAEVLVAVAIGALVMGAAVELLLTGGRLFTIGQHEVHGRAAAQLVMDRLELDLARSIQVPGDPRPPLRVIDDGAVAFYVGEFDIGARLPIEARPVAWTFEEDGDGALTPVRNGVPFPRLHVRSFDATLEAPDVEAGRAGWSLLVRIGLTGRERRVLRRAIPLPQPTSNFLHFPGHGRGLMAGMVRVVPGPESQFAGLGAPDPRPESWLPGGRP